MDSAKTLSGRHLLNKIKTNILVTSVVQTALLYCSFWDIISGLSPFQRLHFLHYFAVGSHYNKIFYVRYVCFSFSYSFFFACLMAIIYTTSILWGRGSALLHSLDFFDLPSLDFLNKGSSETSL